MSTNTNCCQNGFGLGENYHGLVLSEKTKKRKRKRKEKIRERESERKREKEKERDFKRLLSRPDGILEWQR